MSEDESTVWPGGMPRVGQVAERSRKVEATDIERFTEISGDHNPIHYDEAVAKASRKENSGVEGRLKRQSGGSAGLSLALRDVHG